MKQNKLMDVKLSRRGSERPSQASAHRCRICGRPLTDTISINRGIGSECWEKHKAHKRKSNLFKKVEK